MNRIVFSLLFILGISLPNFVFATAGPMWPLPLRFLVWMVSFSLLFLPFAGICFFLAYFFEKKKKSKNVKMMFFLSGVFFSILTIFFTIKNTFFYK